MKTFKPLLAPNQIIDIKTLNYPLLVSFKLDGIRCIFKDGQMYSRALKQFPNIKLKERFEPLMKYSKDHNIILDGELLAKSLTFNELSGLTRQLDKELPDDLFFYCFDTIKSKRFDIPFRMRLINVGYLEVCNYTRAIRQTLVTSAEEIQPIYEKALEWGCDGLILRSPEGYYKFGRGTVKEGLIYKLKPFVTFDAKITGVIQATEVREGAEKKINELGYSQTSKKINDRALIQKAAAFVVLYSGKELKVTISMTDEEKKEVWKNRKSYIGRYIEYKAMEVGMKEDGLPRHPVLVRMRNDK